MSACLGTVELSQTNFHDSTSSLLVSSPMQITRENTRFCESSDYSIIHN